MSVAQRSVNVLRRYADAAGQDQIAAGVFKTTADEIERMIDYIATLDRELAEAKEREEWLRLDAARWALFRDTPSGTFDQYKDEWRFRCNVIGGMWCKSKDDAMDYALSKLQPSGHITQKGDTNADV